MTPRSAADPSRTIASALTADGRQAAHAARLHYVTDAMPGITRRRAGKGWAYRGPDGAPVRDPATLARIRALAVPPAYTDVWICPDPLGHLQATGRDARGRKQYRYHADWRAVRDETKYDRLTIFAAALPRIRARVVADLAQRGLSRDKVLATLVRLMELTQLRVGNPEYVRQNKSFGLTTLRNRHVEVHERSVRLVFKGKSGIVHEADVRSPRLARIVRRLRDLPGQDLFQYLDEDGQRHGIGSDDVNDYLREISGEQITAKDFRTWAGTVLAARALAGIEPLETRKATRGAMLAVIKEVAQALGNTAAICRKCYIHPAVLDGWLDGSLHGIAGALAEPADQGDTVPEGLSAEEEAVAGFLAQASEGPAVTGART